MPEAHPPIDAPPPRHPPAPLGAWRVTLGYLLLTTLWIVGSDRIVESIASSASEQAVLQSIKGLIYVLLSSLALYFVLRRDEHQRQIVTGQLARSERDYRLVFENNPNPMYFFALDDLHLLAVNQAMLDAYGYSREELAGLTLADIRPEEDLPQFRRDIARAASFTRDVWVGQYRHRRRDGSVFDVEIVSHVTTFGERPARLVMAVDISARVSAQRALAASKERYRELVELLPEAVLLVEDERVFFANPAAARLFGVGEAADLAGRALGHLVASTSWPALQARHRAVLAGDGRQQAFAPCVVVGPGDSQVETECAAVPFAGGGNHALQLLLRDMRPWHSAQRALAEANRALSDVSLRVFEAQERERRHLAHELHDQIGQALSAIALRLRLLLGAHGIADDDPQAAPLNRIVADTLEQTRSLSLQLRPPQLDDFGLASALRSLVTRLLADTGIHFELEIEGARDGPPDRVAVAAFRIVQESLTNVLRHADARHVRVELVASAQRMHIKVVDDGRGFDPAAVGAEHLGLLGIRERTALLGGRLSLRSQPGLGTALDVELPLASGE